MSSKSNQKSAGAGDSTAATKSLATGGDQSSAAAAQVAGQDQPVSNPQSAPVGDAPDRPAVVRARVLVASAFGMPNDVVEVGVEIAESSEQLDSNPDAVAAALAEKPAAK